MCLTVSNDHCGNQNKLNTWSLYPSDQAQLSHVCFHIKTINQTLRSVEGVKVSWEERFHASLLSGSCCHWQRVKITAVLSRIFSPSKVYLSIPRTPTSSQFTLKNAGNHHSEAALYRSLILLCNLSHFTFPQTSHLKTFNRFFSWCSAAWRYILVMPMKTPSVRLKHHRLLTASLPFMLESTLLLLCV